MSPHLNLSHVFGGAPMDPPFVLVITRHQAFAEAVRRQLLRLDAIVEIIPPDRYGEISSHGAALAEVALCRSGCHIARWNAALLVDRLAGKGLSDHPGL